MYKRAQAGIGYLPQEASVFRNLSVEDNVAAVLELTELTKPQQKEKLEDLLAEFGLNRVRTSMGNVLSGGERRRTEIARALATDPKFILLDEPFAGIDPDSGRRYTTHRREAKATQHRRARSPITMFRRRFQLPTGPIYYLKARYSKQAQLKSWQLMSRSGRCTSDRILYCAERT
jgi:ABC-type polar amino acid transport system ATPase subunit